MKILRISGRNLASLAGEFEVDFRREPLLSCGLFAISGPTGAGKSTLLDALCVALYDATPRLLRAGGKGVALPDVRDETITPHDTRTLLRRGAGEGHAEVDFIGNDGLSYRARWSIRRARGKSDGGLQKTGMSLCRLPSLQGIGGTNSEVKSEIQQRIGLSFDQFTRAVLLAQNEFSAFLKSDENERGELLETLTGGVLYSEISKRAYQRARDEQAELQQLNLRLADQKPLDQDARGQLDRDYAQSAATVALLDQRQRLLEQHQRWQQESDRFRSAEQQARMEWERCCADRNAAAARWSGLAVIESAQAARPLLAEAGRIAAGLARIRQEISACEVGLARAGAGKEQADAALAIAAAALRAADGSREAAAPQLDHAKALDARIDALAPLHLQSGQASHAARADANAARQALSEKEKELALAQEQLQSHAAWLIENAGLQTLAEAWPRWDTLLGQAARIAAERASCELAAAAARREYARLQAADEEASAVLAASDQAMQAASVGLEQETGRLDGFDPAALQAQRQLLESRRELLASGERIWSELDTQLSRRTELERKSAGLKEAAGLAGIAAQQAGEQQPALEAALAQAERSLRTVEAACGDSVETLRAALEDGLPCPVCGAPEHPYRIDNPQLHAALAGLREEVAQCRVRSRDNVAWHATQAANAKAARSELNALLPELGALAATIAGAALAWDQHPAAAKSGSASSDVPGAWFESQRQILNLRMREQDGREQAWRSAAQSHAQARSEFDRATRQIAQSRQSAHEMRMQLAHAGAVRLSCTEKRDDAVLRLDATLAELDPAFPGRDWINAWRSDPEAFGDQWREQALGWDARRSACDQARVAIVTLELERHALTEAHARALAEAARAAAALASAEAALAALRNERGQLLDGKPVRQIEEELSQALASARQALERRNGISDQAAASVTRGAEALAQAQRQLAGQEQAAAAADLAFAGWLGSFNAEHGGAAPRDRERLEDLLARDGGWISAERAKLQAITSALEIAATVLKERQGQREAHEQALPPGAATAAVPDDLAAALTALAAERKDAAGQTAALQLETGQDDARRQLSSALLAQVERQEANHRRWARLNELIGSADGKKFRNYAQQFTLDVLLGYANRHMAALSRRYRIERIGDTLALMVVDLDMGDEMRSVHSLSGGESFLVSLALALGLASLSSNRVQVESLFIDEGFGSLDAETLRVAIDALDGLQSMGRKVGVISHVQEMTERIGTRILVQRVAGGRSEVSVTAG